MNNTNNYGMPLKLVEHSTFKSSFSNEDIRIEAWIIEIGKTDPSTQTSESFSYGLALTNYSRLTPRRQRLPQGFWALLAKFTDQNNIQTRDIQKINFLPDAGIDREQLNQWVKDLNIKKQCQDFLDQLKAEKKLKEEDDEFWQQDDGF